MRNTIDARAWNDVHARLMVPDHDKTHDAYANIADANRRDALIPDATAVAIASWWAAPRGPGAALAELATTGMGTAQGITRAISDVLDHDDPETIDRTALVAFSRWVREHPSRMHLDEGHPAGTLYGCPACESHCWCDNLTRTTPCVHCCDNDGDGCRVDEDTCRAKLAEGK